MTKEECIKLLLIIKAEYPREHIGINEATTKAQLELWHKMLKEFETELVFKAFQKHITTEEGKYKPSIHHILKNLNSLKNGQTITAGEAWEEVINNIKRFGIYRQYEGVATLSEFTRKVVNQIGYREICLSENLEIIRAQFRKSYEALEKRETEFNNMPNYLKQIQEQSNNRKISGGMQNIKELLGGIA